MGLIARSGAIPDAIDKKPMVKPQAERRSVKGST